MPASAVFLDDLHAQYGKQLLTLPADAPITDLAARLGHTDLKITQRYTEKLRSADNPSAGRLRRRYGIERKKATR